MISMARYHSTSDIQHSKRSHQQSLPDFVHSTEHAPIDTHPHRSFAPSPAFEFDFRLGTDDLAAVKPAVPLVSRRGEPSVEFGLSAFPGSDTTYCQQSYEPPPLQIPSQNHPSDHSPSSYIPSATSTLASHPFPDFPPTSDSRSLSPPEHAGWGDHSSPSLSLSPQDGNPNGSSELAFDARLAHMPFTMDLQSSQPSLQLPLPADHNLPKEARAGAVNSHESPDSGSSDYPLDLPRSKIGPNGLAEDQPPTAQGKMRTRVYVACLQCRSRKIRCDGAKPKCQKCTRRSSECQYDAAPKRRGPDKKPGARQRTSKKAKAAKEGALRRDDEDPDVWGQAAQGSEGEEGGDECTRRKRRRASDGSLSASRTWAADGGEDEDRRTSDTAAAAAAAAIDDPIPSARDVQGVPIPPGIVPDLPDGQKHRSKSRTNPADAFTRARTHMQRSTSHERMPFSFGLDASTGLGGARDKPHTDNPPPIAQHRHPSPQYAHPAPAVNLPYFSHAQITSVDEDEQQESHLQKRRLGRDDNAVGMTSEPSLDFSRKTWWDSLLTVYLPGEDRAKTARQIHTDLQFLFKSSNYFVSFFNVPLFFSIFCNPVERDNMQPSLVLAGLAVATFMRSSEIGHGSVGRMRAIWLRDAAQSSLDASFNAQWIEPTLAQAAWLLALFEMCAHPFHSSERSNSSMVMLDSIIRSLGLTRIDAGDPSACVFPQRTVPVVTSTLASARITRERGCSCQALSLGHNSRSSHTHTPLWAATPAWNPEWSIAEVRREECRRLCWSTLQLAAGHTSHAAAFSAPPLDFYCIQPANYALLFSGEALTRSSSFGTSHSGKESIWALYSRAMLLWNSCLRMRSDDVSDTDKAMFAVGAWIESTAIEEALDRHTCGCDQAFLFQGREFLFITRMCISYEFRRYIPHPESEVNGLFNRRKAEGWLVHQAAVAKRIMQGLHTVTGHKNNVLAQRPFFVWWFMSQAARALMLWSCDNSLLVALEVCQAFLDPIDYLSCLWPCPAQRTRYQNMHARLTQACRTAGLPLPRPPNFDMLAPGSPPVTVV